jgi:cobalt-zinc-cadmium efflux system outer membrane protein
MLLNQYMAQANLTVPVSDYLISTRHIVQAARGNRRAAELSAQVTRHNLGLEGTLAYYAWVRARLEHVAAELSLDQYREHSRVAQAAVEAGRLLPADALRAQAELASAELRRDHSSSAVTISAAHLRTLLREPTGTAHEIGEDVLHAPALAAAPSQVQLLQEAQAQRVELQALAESEAALAKQAAATDAKRYPRLDMFGNAYYANPHPRLIPPQEEWTASWDVGVQVTWVPNELGIASATVRASEAEQRALRQEAAALRDRIALEVIEASQRQQDAQQRVEVSWRVLQAAESAHAARQALYDAGRTTLAELMTAEAQRLDAQLAVVAALIDTRVAHARLAHALGRAPH